MNKSILSLVIIFFTLAGAQGTLSGQAVAQYTFDDCGFQDTNGTFADAMTITPPLCDCGLVDNGLYFDGNSNLNFPAEIDSLFEEDFSISFYFRIDESLSKTDIISIRSECNLDSFIAVTYNPASELITFEISQNISNIQSSQVPLNTSDCWHRMVITKSELFYNLYLDDALAVSILSTGLVNFPKDARLSIANSPCVAVNEDRFVGWIDEFLVYDRALSAIEIINNSLQPDQIITSDTTIVAGAEVNITSGATCATSFTWNPTTDLDDPNSLDPIATPEVTTEYTITFQNDNGCVASDSIKINVIDPSQLDCEKILLPNAFTPNNDLLNDQYGISSLFLVESIEYFEIYDRWGAKMWSASNKNETWDGTFNGSVVNPGMYIYKVKYSCNGNSFVKVDNFSVLR